MACASDDDADADALAMFCSESSSSSSSNGRGKQRLPGAYAAAGAECVTATAVGSLEGSQQVSAIMLLSKD